MKLLALTAVATASIVSLSVFAQATPATNAPVDPSTFINQFESTFGKFEGYRRSGAKGICAIGEFVGTADARGLSTASVFSGATIPVVVRFSVGGANPKVADNGKSQRNLALQFNLPGGEQWLMGNISSPVFGASSPQQFIALLASRQPDPVTKMPDPAKVKAFNDANPEVLLIAKHFASQPVPASYASVNYWGVHGYGFTNASGRTQYGKWIFEPTAGLQGLSDDEAKAKGASFLFDDLRERVKAGKVAFNFNLELAQAGDNVDNATIPLPEGRKKVNLGTLKVTSVAEDAGGTCLTINFNPLVMPKGVVASADPLLPARAAPYAISLGRRLGEGAKQQ
jgi:catalase